jgi:hypothetical protein
VVGGAFVVGGAVLVGGAPVVGGAVVGGAVVLPSAVVGGAVVVAGGGRTDRVGTVTEGRVGRAAVESAAPTGVDTVGNTLPGRSDGSETPPPPPPPQALSATPRTTAARSMRSALTGCDDMARLPDSQESRAAYDS